MGHPPRGVRFGRVIWGKSKGTSGELRRTHIHGFLLLLHLLHERRRPDEQDYLAGLWRGCDFTACVPRSISVVKNFFRAEVLEV